MASDAEPAKQLLPYLQRADELQKHEPLVAYYCRLFAMEKGLKIPAKERTKTTNSLLFSLMNQLEKDKKAVKLSADDNLYIEGFASNVFSKADKQDRAGRADINTAKTFYAASIFFEILIQFGELPPDIEQKQKYALWKAADIRKALKEGRKPIPGPPGGEEDLSVPSSSDVREDDPAPSLNVSNGQSDGHPSPHVDRADFQYEDKRSTLPSHPGTDYQSADFLPAPPSTRVSGSYPQHPTYQSQPTEQNPPPPQNYTYDGSPHSYSPHDPHTTNYSHETAPHIPPVPPHDPHTTNYSHETAPHIPPVPPHDPHTTNYSHETVPHVPPVPPYTYPNFQSYPSFTESSLPTAPSHYPSYHQGSDNAYSHQPPPASNYPATSQYSSGTGSASHSPPPPAPPAATFTYDSNYQPSVEKIAEAHRAARFAVGALAFDDVPVAVDFLIKSLELLTNPSAETH